MVKHPLLGALAVVIRDNAVLLVQRSKNPGAGLWGYPGGHVEWGETVLQAAVRELHEETGVRAEPLEYLTNFDLLISDENARVSTHYLLVGVACRYLSGTPVAGDDALDARWIDLDAVRQGQLAMHDRVGDLLDFALTRQQSAQPE